MKTSEFQANEMMQQSNGFKGTLTPSKARVYYVQSKRRVSSVYWTIANAGLWLVVLPLVAKFN